MQAQSLVHPRKKRRAPQAVFPQSRDSAKPTNQTHHQHKAPNRPTLDPRLPESQTNRNANRRQNQ
jgi:hypothetical protein